MPRLVFIVITMFLSDEVSTFGLGAPQARHWQFDVLRINTPYILWNTRYYKKTD